MQSDNSPEDAAKRDPQEHKPTDPEPESFQKILKATEKCDEESVKAWREDIDTLLVFAGIFSGVIAAFLIESYHTLEEDPADKTVLLLEQLVLFQRNASLALTADPIPPFKPDASMVRINCFWFLSLTFSITSALYGLLCKQWIREFARDTPTSTAAESLALRQLRRDGFEKWKVPAFISTLPILLEVAVILFFVGILDLLWGLHRTPFIATMTVVAVSAVVYFTTTLLPTVMIPKNLKTDIENRHFERLSYQFICPYKTPQAWAVYRFTCSVLSPLSKLWYSTEEFEKKYNKAAPALHYHIESPASDWALLDLRVVRQYDQKVKDSKEKPLQVYHLRAFEWAVTMFRDNPSMIPHLRKVLAEMSPSVAMSAVLGRWNIGNVEVSKKDVDAVVIDPQHSIPYTSGTSDNSNFTEAGICRSRNIKALFERQFPGIERNPSDASLPTSTTYVSDPKRCHADVEAGVGFDDVPQETRAIERWPPLGGPADAQSLSDQFSECWDTQSADSGSTMVSGEWTTSRDALVTSRDLLIDDPRICSMSHIMAQNNTTDGSLHRSVATSRNHRHTDQGSGFTAPQPNWFEHRLHRKTNTSSKRRCTS